MVRARRLPLRLALAAFGLVLALAAWGDSHSRLNEIPRGPDGLRDPQQLKEYFDGFEQSYSGEYNDEWDKLDEAEQDAVDEIWDVEQEANNERLVAEGAREDAAASLGEQWAEVAARNLVINYQALPPGVQPTGAARTGEQLVRSQEYYKKELERLGGELSNAVARLQGTESRIATLNANLQAHEADDSIWSPTTWLDDRRSDYLDAQIAMETARLPGLRMTVVTASESFDNTLAASLRLEHSLVINGIRADPAAVAQDNERRVREIIALEQDLAVTRMQFVAGQAQWQLVIEGLEQKAEDAREAGDDSLANGYGYLLEDVRTAYDMWLNGIQVSINGKGKLIMDAYERNAQEGIGPTNNLEVISHLTGCGVDAGMVLNFRNPQTNEYVYPEYNEATGQWEFPNGSTEFAFPDVKGRVDRAEFNAERQAKASIGQDLTYDWLDYTADSTEAFFTLDTITGAPERLVYAGKGAAVALGTAVYDLGVFGVELGDTILETDQWYANQFLSSTPFINSLGLEIDWFGQENIEAGGAFIHWASEDYSAKVYGATQSYLGERDRRREMQAGRGDAGTLEAIEDVTYEGTSVVTIFFGPEDLLLQAVAKGTRGAKVLDETVQVGQELAEAGAAGSRAADAGTGARALDEAIPGTAGNRAAGQAPGQGIPADVAEAATPRPGGAGQQPGTAPGQGISDDFAEAATPRPGGAGQQPGTAPGQGISDDFAEAATPRPGGAGQQPGTAPGQGISDDFAEAATPQPQGTSAGGEQPPAQGMWVSVLDFLGQFKARRSDGRVVELTEGVGAGGIGGGGSAFSVPFANPVAPERYVVKITKKEGATLEKIGDAALEGIDPAVALSPKTHVEYPIRSPGSEFDGGVLSSVDRVPRGWFDATKAAIKAAGGLTDGMKASLRRALDAIADKGYAMADLKLDNLTFRPAGPPGSDKWVPVFFDKNAFIQFKSPEAAKAFHEALMNPPAKYLQGNWTEKMEEWVNELARRFDNDINWEAMQAGNPNLATLAHDPTHGFPFNPYIGKQAPELRTAGDLAEEAATPMARDPGPDLTQQPFNPRNAMEIELPWWWPHRASRPPGVPFSVEPTQLPGGGLQWVNWAEKWTEGLEPPWLFDGAGPRVLRDMGVDVNRLPGMFGEPPVRVGAQSPGGGICIPDNPRPPPGTNAAASSTAAAGEGTVLHLGYQWLKSQKALTGVERANIAPFVTGRFMIGQCEYAQDPGCATATGVIALNYPASQATQVALAIESMNVPYSGPDNLRRKQELPDDPYYRSRGAWGQDHDDQWALKKVGLDAGLPAWPAAQTGAGPVVVAVVDTGVAWNHRDVGVDRLWINTDEVPANGVDDDGNGYVDDIVGWNFVDQTNLPWDLDGHGTLVAGIIGAATNNGRGTAGVNSDTRIMVLRALDEVGNGRVSAVAEAITYAANNGARVINLSLGGEGLAPTEQLAIDYAHSKGVLVVVAAGNEGIRLEDYGPGGADHVVTVAASDPADRRLVSSNWGPQVDLAAPGVDVLGPRAMGTDLMANIGLADYVPGSNVVGADRGYYRATGSSFAAPVVAGVASLLLTANPALSNDQLQRMLVNSAVDIEMPGIDQFTGYGRLDARAAMAADPGYFLLAKVTGIGVAQADGVPVIQVSGSADADRMKQAWLELGAGEAPAEWRPVAVPITQPVRDGVIQSFDPRALAGASQWTLRLIIEHQDGSRREARYLLNTGG